MANYKDKVLFLGKHLVNWDYKHYKSFLFGKTGLGSFSHLPIFMSLRGEGTRDLLLTTENTVIDDNGIHYDDKLSFKYNITQIVRKKPITSMTNGYYTFNQPLVIADPEQRTYYVKLENGDLYKIIINRSPYNIEDINKYPMVSEKKHIVAKHISPNCSVVVEAQYGNTGKSVYFEDFDDSPSVKTGDGIAPVITAFNVDSDWVGVTFFPSPVYLTFLGFRKSEFENATSGDDNNVSLYLVAKTDKGTITRDVAFYDSGVKKAFVYRDKDGNDKFIALTEAGNIYLDNTKIGSGLDIGVYWTEIRSLKGGCLNYTPVEAQRSYLENYCTYSNPNKAITYCESRIGAWGGVGAKNSKFSPELRTVHLNTCRCKWYQDVKNEFDDVMRIGVPIWQESETVWHSFNPDFECYYCDGSNATKTCGQADDEIKETIEAIDFYMQNKQKKQLLISKSIDGEFYEVPAIGYAPLRISYFSKGKIVLPR